MDMKEVVRIGLLMDLYENLTERQRDIMHQYINEDFSLNEISELTGVTRQAAHDTVKIHTPVGAIREGLRLD